jgi:hypothetical protein
MRWDGWEGGRMNKWDGWMDKWIATEMISNCGRNRSIWGMMTDSNASRNPADSTKGLLIIPMLLVAWLQWLHCSGDISQYWGIQRCSSSVLHDVQVSSGYSRPLYLRPLQITPGWVEVRRLLTRCNLSASH